MKLVVAVFILYPQQNKYRGSHADCKAYNIDSRKSFIAQKVSKGNFEVVCKHAW
jgi:hypothetical protein